MSKYGMLTGPLPLVATVPRVAGSTVAGRRVGFPAKDGRAPSGAGPAYPSPGRGRRPDQATAAPATAGAMEAVA
ncbi:hypothetical protein [Plantactinospora sp. GCM10030261]|uniref:hypothetical protein n=1 Tax=Plantactinospora sp. GCM10030261 TaxID=3273420 RepID=UPI00361A3EDF